jgi:hypothetical protein
MERSEILANRSSQPGDSLIWRRPEEEVFNVLQKVFADNEITNHPTIKNLFGSKSLQPDFKITNKESGRHFYVEVKYQGPRGNAHERLYKHYCPGVAESYLSKCGSTFKIITICTGHLAVLPKYIDEIRCIVGLDNMDNVFFWTPYNTENLIEFLLTKKADWICD